MFGLLLILVLAIMGGIIAYIGDKLGMKIGKKRLTIFGLRPKHTSILITILTGVLIAATTLLFLTAVSQDVRTALFGMKALKKELVELSSAVKEKNALLDLTKENLAIKTLALNEKEKQYSSLSKQVKTKTALLIDLEKELKGVIAQRNEQARKINLLSEQYAAINQKLALAEGDITKLQQTKEQLAVKIADLELTKEKLTKEVADREELARRLSLGLEIVREGNIAFRSSQELGSQVIQGNSLKDVQQQIKQLILAANTAALEQGARPEKEGETAIWLSSEELDKVVKGIARSKKPTVVRLLCATNTVLGESVPATFQLFENKQIFQKGEVVLQDKLDGRQPENIIEAQLVRLLQKVNTTAVKKGMIPDPLRGTVGSVPALEIYNTVKKVKDANREVEIAVIATEDANVSDSLKVRLQVRK